MKFQIPTRGADPAITIKFERVLPGGWSIERESMGKEVVLSSFQCMVAFVKYRPLYSYCLGIRYEWVQLDGLSYLIRFLPEKCTSGTTSPMSWSSCMIRRCTRQGSHCRCVETKQLMMQPHWWSLKEHVRTWVQKFTLVFPQQVCIHGTQRITFHFTTILSAVDIMICG